MRQFMGMVAGLADNILIGTMSGYTKEWDINGEKGMFGVEKTTD